MHQCDLFLWNVHHITPFIVFHNFDVQHHPLDFFGNIKPVIQYPKHLRLGSTFCTCSCTSMTCFVISENTNNVNKHLKCYVHDFLSGIWGFNFPRAITHCYDIITFRFIFGVVGCSWNVIQYNCRIWTSEEDTKSNINTYLVFYGQLKCTLSQLHFTVW